MPDYDAVIGEIESLLEDAREEGRDEVKEGDDYGYCGECDRRDCDDCDRGNCDDCERGYCPECSDADEAYDRGWNEALDAAAKELALGDYLDKFKKED